MRRSLAVLLMATALIVVPTTSQAESSPVRIMVLGDSLSHGTAGDWSWRYRLWQHLSTNGVAVDFVGPRDGLFGPDFPAPSYAYPDPSFDDDHASRWGLALGLPEFSATELMADHDPDVVVVELGINDLTWLGQSPGWVVDRLVELVVELRAADPKVDVVLTHAPPAWIDGVPELNDLIDQESAGLDSEQSRVVVASADEDYGRVTHTYDIVHPNAAGELVIAAAVEDALSGIGVGPVATRPVMSTPLGPRIPPVAEVTAGDGSADVIWVPSPGATSHVVWQRDTITGEPATKVAEVSGSAVRVDGLVNGHDYAFQVQPVKGFWPAEADAWSRPVQVRPRADGPGAITSVVVGPGDRQLDLRWDDKPSAVGYRVWFQLADGSSGWSTLETDVPAATLRELVAGAAYQVAVQGRGVKADGPLSPMAGGRAGGVTPAGADITVKSVDAAGRLVATWQPIPEARSYDVRLDAVGDGVPLVKVTQQQAWIDANGLVAGSTYVLSVVGVNGELRGPRADATFRVPPRLTPAGLSSPGAVRRVRLAVSRRGVLRSSGRAVSGAEAYDLAVAPSSSCRRSPNHDRFLVVRSALDEPRSRVRLPRRVRRAHAVWVRWRAVRAGTKSAVRKASMACVRLD
ncbi:MAG: GDSL-type esterase/lipase family protein [Nocardioides sp.]|uniref:GDSL-type esterase/lipase family protein n=1 Tax=Nocardioides sp. TaxID=35761 RepID=UPI003266B074